MQRQVSPKITVLVFGILTITFLAAFYVVAWQEPSLTPPEGNVAAPINVGTEPQAKAGRISATEYYDYNDPSFYLNPNTGSRLAADIEICKNGVCCPIYKDCDGDYFTYGTGDCDESCPTCYGGIFCSDIATAQSYNYVIYPPRCRRLGGACVLTPDGKDQDCDGTIDELQCNTPPYVQQLGDDGLRQWGYDASCVWKEEGKYKWTMRPDYPQYTCGAGLGDCCECEIEVKTNSRGGGGKITCGGIKYYESQGSASDYYNIYRIKCRHICAY